ncbi:phage major capsid protein [Planctomyces sp. SH-PL14]|uniref:phage major capsid protein n=1 Tax=Planctomyces sp. SH-PL14 TaxID=1632864 RepID=UPI00078DC6C0|nr:phage major capsid protein [Planctomyces sp. SH-PL14]AMV20417.1 Phage capsid family protein [Planctomyces sp. SH-PL14]
MPSLQELREKRATIVNTARTEYEVAAKKAKAENRDLSEADELALNKALDAADALTKDIEAGETAEQKRTEALNRLTAHEDALKKVNRGELEKVAGSAVNNSPFEQEKTDPSNDQSTAMRGWFLNQLGEEVPDACVEAGKRCGLNPLAKNLDIKLSNDYGRLQREYFNALSSNNPATGGILRLGSVLGPLEQAMLWYGPMLQTSQVIRTSDANPMAWPTADDTTNTGSQIGESAAVPTATDPAFAAMVMNAYKWTSGVIKVPFELLRDSAINLPQLLGEMLGERLGRIINTRATTGTGAATIKGIVTASTMGKTTSSNSAVTADEFIDFQHSVPIAYRNGAAFMFNDSTLKVLRKLKSNDSQYIWQPGLQVGMPGTLLGSPYHINEDVASIAASAKIALYGQLNRYKIRQVNRIRLYRLEERYRENDQDGFMAFVEVDGNLLDAGKGAVRHLLMNT